MTENSTDEMDGTPNIVATINVKEHRDATVVFVDKDGNEVSHLLNGWKQKLMGNDPLCLFHLQGTGVGRRHVGIVLDDDGEDLVVKVKNVRKPAEQPGRINGERLSDTWRALVIEDVLTIGCHTLTLKSITEIVKPKVEASEAPKKETPGIDPLGKTIAGPLADVLAQGGETMNGGTVNPVDDPPGSPTDSDPVDADLVGATITPDTLPRQHVYCLLLRDKSGDGLHQPTPYPLTLGERIYFELTEMGGLGWSLSTRPPVDQSYLRFVAVASQTGLLIKPVDTLNVIQDGRNREIENGSSELLNVGGEVALMDAFGVYLRGMDNHYAADSKAPLPYQPLLGLVSSPATPSDIAPDGRAEGVSSGDVVAAPMAGGTIEMKPVLNIEPDGSIVPHFVPLDSVEVTPSLINLDPPSVNGTIVGLAPVHTPDAPAPRFAPARSGHARCMICKREYRIGTPCPTCNPVPDSVTAVVAARRDPPPPPPARTSSPTTTTVAVGPSASGTGTGGTGSTPPPPSSPKRRRGAWAMAAIALLGGLAIIIAMSSGMRNNRKPQPIVATTERPQAVTPKVARFPHKAPLNRVPREQFTSGPDDKSQPYRCDGKTFVPLTPDRTAYDLTTVINKTCWEVE